MWRIRKLLFRLYHSVRPNAAEPDLQREIASHLHRLEDELSAAGATPDEARRRARQVFGGLEKAKEQHRDARSFRWISEAITDARLAIRRLAATPVASFVAIGSLALGLGALVGVYSTFDWLVDRAPGAVGSPDEVFALNTADRNAPGREGYFFSYAQFQVVQAAERPFASVAAYGKLAGVVSTTERTDQTVIEVVSGEFFTVLGVRPALGRMLSVADDHAASPIPVVLSHAFWRTYFNADTQVVGRTLRLNGQVGEVIGVAPRAFESMNLDWNGPTDLWAPLTAATSLGSRLLTTAQPFFPILTRVRPPLTIDVALQQLRRIVPSLPPHLNISGYQPTQIVAIPLREMRIARRDSSQAFFRPLLVVCGLVLLAACFNLSEFMAGRVYARRVELAVRSALGASRRRLLGQLIVESTGIAALAVAAATPVSYAVIHVLSAASRLYLGLPTMAKPVVTTAAFDWWTFGVLGVAGAACVIVFGTVPALAPVFASHGGHLRPQQATWSRRADLLAARQLFIAGQVALAVALSVIATIYALSFLHVSRVDSGYGDPSHVLLARLNTAALPASDRPTFYQQLMEGLRSDPAVAGAAFGWQPPFVVGHNRVWQPGQEQGGRTIAISGGGRDFFSVQQLPVLAGREFDDSPHDAQSSVIVNATFARVFWPGRTSLPLGETLVVPLGSQQVPRTVIGIVRDEHCDNLLSANERPCAYLPVSFTESLGMLRIRTRVAPLAYAETLRRRVRLLHPDAAVSEDIALDGLLDALTAQHRAAMLASAGLAVFAVVLVTAGLIAVFTAMVRLRERDLALRLALGAAPSMLQRRMLWRGVAIASVGVVIGMALAWWAGRIVAPQLYGVDVHVPWLLVVPLGLGMVAVLAVARAARLIWRIDPALPLKSASVG